MNKYESAEIEIVKMTSDIITLSHAFDGKDDDLEGNDW